MQYPEVPLGLAEAGSEAYTLSITRGGARLEAFSVWGALSGMWTLTQLVTPFESLPSGTVVFYLPLITIDDWPR